MKLSWKTLPLTDATVVAHIEQCTALGHDIMIAEKSRSRGGRKHLKLNKDGEGYYVRVGMRGSLKQYLGRCDVTYSDGKPMLFQFTLADQDAFDADQTRKWLESCGITE